MFRIAAEGGDALAGRSWQSAAARPRQRRTVRTREWFEKAAASGDLIAAFNFGVCLAEGVGIERDDRKAAEWLRRAADGVVNAQYWYGRMLVEGRGVEANPEEGRKWIAKAAGVGMVEAEVMLAEMTLSGRGGPKDHPAALALFQKAADRGHVGAMFAMGAMYGGGHEVPVDRPSRSAGSAPRPSGDIAYAQMMLGRYLARGLAGELDFDRARTGWNGRSPRACRRPQPTSRRCRAAAEAPAGRTAGDRAAGSQGD